MLFQATVPNTWAAGVASKATWRAKRKRKTEAAPPQKIVGPRKRCECGNWRSIAKESCPRCHGLETHFDPTGLDSAVYVEIVNTVGGLTPSELVEELSYKWPRDVIYRSCRRLMADDRVIRVRVNRPNEPYVYMRR